jgi:hypothetical protein
MRKVRAAGGLCDLHLPSWGSAHDSVAALILLLTATWVMER